MGKIRRPELQLNIIICLFGCLLPLKSMVLFTLSQILMLKIHQCYPSIFMPELLNEGVKKKGNSKGRENNFLTSPCFQGPSSTTSSEKNFGS